MSLYDDLLRARALLAALPYEVHQPLLSPGCGLRDEHAACRSAICECGCHVRDPFWDHVCGCRAWTGAPCNCDEQPE